MSSGSPRDRRGLAPEGVHHVLAGASGRYRKDNRLYAELRTAFGNGLLTSQDDRWLRQKRAARL